MGMDRKIEKKKWPWWRIALYMVISVAVVYGLNSLYQQAGTSRLNVDQERILLDTVHQGVFKEYITIFGTVEPFKTVYLDAVESGKIEEIYVEDGSVIKEGTPILRLSNLDLQLSVLNQEAQIIDQINTIRNQTILMDQQSLRLKEDALSVDYQIALLSERTRRNKLLYQDSAIAMVEYQETRDEYEFLLNRRKLLKATITQDSLYQAMQQNQMESSVDLMRRNLEFAKNSLDNLTVRAPIDGQLSSLDSEIGELINEGDRIAQIDVLDTYKIRARIDEFYISRIFPNQEGSFTMDGVTYTLKIKKIYPEVSEGSFEVDLYFDDQFPKNIKRGQTIALKLSLSDETEARLLAKGGFFQETGGNWVYEVDPQGGVARKKSIRIGRQNPDYYEVIDGLDEGDIIIVSSYENYNKKEELILK
jgi:HlyD family secretion protein